MAKKQMIFTLSKVGNLTQMDVTGTKGDECLLITEGIKQKTRSTGVEQVTQTTDEYLMDAETTNEKEKAEMHWSE